MDGTLYHVRSNLAKLHAVGFDTYFDRDRFIRDLATAPSRKHLTIGQTLHFTAGARELKIIRIYYRVEE
jgi:hypothetical protein